MSVVTKEIQDQVSQLYIAFFGRAPDALGFAHWTQGLASGFYTVNTLAAQFGKSPEFESNYGGLTPAQQVNRLYQNVLNRDGDPAGVAYWEAKVLAGLPFSEVAWEIVNTAFTGGPGVGAWDQALVVNKAAVSLYFATTLASNDGALAKTAFNGVTSDPATVTAAEARLAQSSESTFTLTTGVDTATAQVFTGLVNGAGSTFTPLDTLTGQGSNASANTLRLIDQAGGLNTTDISPVGASLSNIGNLEIVGNGSTDVAGQLSTAAALFSGVTNVSLTNSGISSLTGSATQNLTVTNTVQAGSAVVIDGGNNVTATLSGVGIGATTVGATLATGAAGNVVVSSALVAGTNLAGGLITINGGDTVTVTRAAAAATTVNEDNTQSDVIVNTNGSTTAVTINGTAAVTKSADVGGIVQGAVTIIDRNAATKADTIGTVSLSHFGATTITSNALSTLNLTGDVSTSASGAVTLTASAGLTADMPTTLALNVNGGSIGAISGTKANVYTTVNISGTTAATTIADLTATALKTLNVSGDKAVTLTANALGGATTTAIVSTNTAGVTLGGVLDVATQFTGGDGNDSIVIGATTKAINMGAGNDVVTLNNVNALGAGGSLNGGSGTNTLVANVNGSSFSADPAFSNFQTLRVAGTTAQGTHNANGFTALEVGALAGAATFSNVAAGVGLTQLATMGHNLTVTIPSASGTADSFNLTMRSAGAIGAAGQTITLAGIETVNITNVDTNTTAHQNTVELVAANATAINVSGNAGLIVINAPSLVTSFDASGVVLGKATDLGVNYTATNTAVGSSVAITGSNGADTLVGGNVSSGVDTIIGGAGNDRIEGRAGNDILTGGAGADTFVFSGTGGLAITGATILAANGRDTITDFTAADKDVLSVATLLATTKTFLSTTSTSAEAAGTAIVVKNNIATTLDASGVDQLAASVSSSTASGVILFSNNGVVQLWYDQDIGNAGGAAQMAHIATFTGTTLADLAALTADNFVI